MTATDDDTIPDRGDPITMLGGQFSGQHGTMLRRNGTSARVALHAPAHVIVQALDGSVWAAEPGRLLPITPVQPRLEFVVKRV